MPADTVPLLLDLDVPLQLIETLVRQHVLAALRGPDPDHARTNGHANGHATPPTTQEAPAPVVPSTTGAP